MSQQMLKSPSPASLLAPKVQVARVFTAGHRHARSARTIVKPSRASREGSREERAALSSGGLTADHPKHNMQLCTDASYDPPKTRNFELLLDLMFEQGLMTC